MITGSSLAARQPPDAEEAERQKASQPSLQPNLKYYSARAFDHEDWLGGVLAVKQAGGQCPPEVRRLSLFGWSLGESKMEKPTNIADYFLVTLR